VYAYPGAHDWVLKGLISPFGGSACGLSLGAPRVEDHHAQLLSALAEPRESGTHLPRWHSCFPE